MNKTESIILKQVQQRKSIMGNFYSFVQEFIQTSLGRNSNWEPASVREASLLKRVLSAKPRCQPSDQSVHGLPDRIKDLETTEVQLEDEKYPISPNFDFITNLHERHMLSSAYKTITRLQKWDYLCEYIISEKTGYMFSTESTINELMNQINTDYELGHSGCSMGCTMRTMDLIAKNGFDSFRESVIQDTNQPCNENVDHVEASVVQEHWLHVNQKTHSMDEEEEEDDEMPALEPVSDDDEDDEMPALESVSDVETTQPAKKQRVTDDDDDDEMPALIPDQTHSVAKLPAELVVEGHTERRPSDPSMYPLDPSFDFMKLYKREAESAYQTVQKMEMWNYLYNHNTEKKRGYMFSEDPKIIDLSNQIQEDYGGLHSGSSMALTLRFMELIAKEGFDVFREECIRQNM
uniref:Uncharacterized protein n=1 Tax=viral metagenome TaxID=1070528 RepID=A0A6C0HUU4_9ZZZZ